jgi:hypothetical protein
MGQITDDTIDETMSYYKVEIFPNEAKSLLLSSILSVAVNVLSCIFYY